jgi:hypothetical protein
MRSARLLNGNSVAVAVLYSYLRVDPRYEMPGSAVDDAFDKNVLAVT